MKKINVLITGMSSNLGGIENYLINLFRHIDKTKVQMTFLIIEGKLPCFYDEIKDNIIYIKNRSKNYIKAKQQYQTFFKKHHFDIVHFNLMSYSFFELIESAKKENIPIILHSHTADVKFDSIKTQILDYIGKYKVKKNDYSIKIACSKKAGIYMFNDFNNQHFKVYYNGIDTHKFIYNDKNRHNIRAQFNIHNNDFVIGNVGRFVKSKNQTFLLKIFYEIQKIKPQSKLILIGDGPEKNNIIKEIEKLNLKEKVILTGFVNNVNAYMSAFDTFVFPSLFEGLGLVILEAQTSGLPCFIQENIPKEVDICNLTYRMPIKTTPIEWANNIIKICHQNNTRHKPLNINKIDINYTAKEIEKLYIDIKNNQL